MRPYSFTTASFKYLRNYKCHGNIIIATKSAKHFDAAQLEKQLLAEESVEGFTNADPPQGVSRTAPTDDRSMCFYPTHNRQETMIMIMLGAGAESLLAESQQQDVEPR